MKAGNRVAHEDFGLGTVLYVDYECIAVEFDRSNFQFHSFKFHKETTEETWMDGMLEDHGYWVHKDELSLVN